MHNQPNQSTYEPSVLASLRSLVPTRALQFSEALRIAELQANRLLQLLAITDGPVPSEIVSELPRIQVRYRELPTSGLSYWNGETWVIGLNRAEPRTRQRFTLLHEYKHILDHGRAEYLYRADGRYSAAERAEQVADYFAGCALMPKRLVKRAWGEGMQRTSELARLFDVSERAIRFRLTQLGLADQSARCSSVSDLAAHSVSGVEASG